MGAHSRAREHARLSRKTAVMTMTAAAATAGGIATAAPAGAATSPRQQLINDLARLRMCESGGNYAIDTGNGYYGAYQFDLPTWEGLGLRGLPSQASKATQDAAAARLESERGWEPWPACSEELGLQPIYGVTLSPASVNEPVVVHAAHQSTSEAAVPVKAAEWPHLHVPRYRGTVLTSALIGERRADVMLWQARMRARGWNIMVDGYFGPQSQAVAAAFTAEFHIKTAFPGQVDLAVWRAAWTMRIVD